MPDAPKDIYDIVEPLRLFMVILSLVVTGVFIVRVFVKLSSNITSVVTNS
jgi:hypothetical protein